MGTGNLQSTMLEGHGINPPDLDLSAIDGKWFLYFRVKLARMVPSLGWPCCYPRLIHSESSMSLSCTPSLGL